MNNDNTRTSSGPVPTKRLNVMHYLSTHTIMGGLESNVLTVCEFLDQSKINSKIACREDSHQEVFNWAARIGVQVHTFKGGGYRDVPSYIKRTAALVALLRREQIDVLHIHAIGYSGLNAFVAADLARAPAVVVSHHSWFGGEPSRPTEAVSRWLEKRRAWTIALFSEEAREMAAAGIPAQRIVGIPHSVDLRRFNYDESDRLKVAKSPVFTVAIVARMIEGKGHEELLHAVHLLKERYPQLRLLMIGDGATRPQLEARIHELGLKDVVEITGYVPNEQVPDLIRDAQVIALPSYYSGEVFGIALIEGMAMGLAALGSRYVAIPDIVSDGETGLLVEPRDVQGLTAAIEKMVSDPAMTARMGQRARTRVEQLYSAEVIGNSMTDLYFRAAAQSGRKIPAVRNDVAYGCGNVTNI